MRSTARFLAVCALSPAAVAAQEVAPAEMIAERRLAFDHAFNRADLESLAALVTDDVSFVTVAGGNPPGAQAFLEDMRQMLAERPGLAMWHEPQAIEVGPEPWGVASERGRWVESWLWLAPAARGR